jgi:hypothetical protein
MEPIDAAIAAIRTGDPESLARLLREHPSLASARITGNGGARTLLHIATDWPGHLPRIRATVETLAAGGADLNAVFLGHPTHAETPLHWAASSDDLDALDALLDLGANLEAPGAVIGGGTALADAVAFRCWRAARRLIERGARTTLPQAAALGLLDRMQSVFASDPPPCATETTKAFWYACHGGQQEAAEYLLAHAPDIHWIGWDHLTPLDTASRGGFSDLVRWLRLQGARSGEEYRK